MDGAELVERSLPTTEICGSKNLAISNFTRDLEFENLAMGKYNQRSSVQI